MPSSRKKKNPVRKVITEVGKFRFKWRINIFYKGSVRWVGGEEDDTK